MTFEIHDKVFHVIASKNSSGTTVWCHEDITHVPMHS